MSADASLREQLGRFLAWQDAHVSFDTAIAGIPVASRGKRPRGVAHSPWQILEHLRRAQRDILDFCHDPDYEEKDWPADYWPTSPAPPSASAWNDSVRRYREDRKALQDLAADTKTDLFARIPHGDGQTHLRELILAADHAAYHIGELVVVRRLLGIWKST